MSITHKIEEVTPEYANKMLTTNVKNRSVIRSAVTQYSDAMARGYWLFDGSPIRIDKTNSLQDGQHRLLAVVESGKTQKFLIIRGLDPEAQNVMDTGRKRSLSDILSLRGESHHQNLAALTLIIYRWEKGARGTLLLGEKQTSVMRPQTTEVLAYLEDHPELREIVKRAEAVRRHVPLSIRVIGLCIWLFDNINAEDSQNFWEAFMTGQNLKPHSPILALRTILLKRGPERGSTSLNSYIALFIKAWNAYRAGEEVQKLKYIPGGSKPEPFPEPK